MKKLILSLFALIVTGFAQAQETVPQTQDTLKSYFVTGAVPTQNDFDEWIDTMFWYVNATYTNALAAQQTAAYMQTNIFAARIIGSVAVPSDYTVTDTIHTSMNITNVTAYHIGNGDDYLSFNFITPFADTNYIIDLSGIFGNSLDEWTLVKKTTTNCVVEFAENVPTLPTQNFVLTFYP